MTPGELSALLAARAEQVCRELLPAGKHAAGEWQAGDVGGSAGKSLCVHLVGEKAGVWSDFATGETGGDLLDLIRAVRGVDLREAMAHAKAMLGIHDPEWTAAPKPTFRRPTKPKCSSPRGAVREYLASRGISEATLGAYHVGERGHEIVFPFLRDGELIMAKVREARDGAKPKPTEAGCEKCLFGWQVVPEAARDVIITEGEIDAMSVYELGFPALSVPFGGGGGNKQDWIEHEFEHLQRFDQVFLCLDRDAAGEQAVDEIIKRLGRHRCRVVDIPAPHKDANDLLRAGFTTQDMARLLGGARSLDPAELRPAASYVDEVIAEFYPPDEIEPGISLPWQKTQAQIRLRPGETIVLAGFNGHGKTEIAGHLTLGALAQCERACVASMEFKAHKWLKRLTRQAAGMERPSEGYIRAIHEWYEGRLWTFDVRGSAKAERILEVFHYAARRYRVRFFVIDNLAKCGFDEDDYNGQKAFVDQLTDFATEHDAMVLLIHHMKKTQDEKNAGGKMDVKGSGAITDMVDTVLLAWRNKRKEEAARQLGQLPPDKADEPDAYLRCEKQRNGEHEPVVALWFDRASHQFLEHPHGRPRKFVDYSVTQMRGGAA